MSILLAKMKYFSVNLPLFAAHRNSLLHIHPILIHTCSAFPTQNPNPQTPNFSVDDYLISSFGFSSDKAARVSKPIAHLKSPEKPEAVIRFLNHQGFSEVDIKKLITWVPRILCSSPENTLAPNLCALRKIGLSTSALTKLILSNPQALQLRAAVPRIKFWMDFLGGNESDLIKVFQQNKGVLSRDITKNIEPKISLLLRHGVSIPDIRRIMLMVNGFMTSSVSSMDDPLKRAAELGFQTDSGMFVVGLRAMICVTREALQKKMELLKSFGWSGDEFLLALRKAPGTVTLTESNLLAKMDFFTKEARCEPSYTASNPLLLSFSLEKRLRPRLHVLQLLESKGISIKGQGLYSAINMSNKKFVERYIIPHKHGIPKLCEVYPTSWTS